nr:hypothetical protein [Tanacetum cinerariifolium]
MRKGRNKGCVNRFIIEPKVIHISLISAACRTRRLLVGGGFTFSMMKNGIEDPNRDGEPGFDYLTFVLVLSKAHREGCRDLRGRFLYWGDLRAEGEGTSSSPQLNVMLSIPSFICKVLNYFKVHISHFNLVGMVKLTTFAFMCRAYGGEPTVNLLCSFLNLGRDGDWLTLSNRDSLKTSWKYSPKEPVIYYRGQVMNFKSFMMQEIDGEFKFLPKGCIDDNQCSPSPKYVNNEASVIDVKPLTFVHPSDFVKDVADSDDASAGDNENPLVGTSLPPLPEASSKVASEASDPLDVDSDPDIHEFPSAKELCDIHDREYMCQVVLDNVLNSRTQDFIFALHKAIASCDAIRARELEKDIAYAELERKCNEALLDLDQNPLVADMWTEIKTLQGQRERERLKLSEIYLLQEMDALKQDKASVVAKVVPDAATKLIRSDEMGMLVAKLVKASIIYGRCAAFKKVAKLKEPFFMEKMAGYRPSSKQEYDQAGDDLANASYPFLSKYVMTPMLL